MYNADVASSIHASSKPRAQDEKSDSLEILRT